MARPSKKTIYERIEDMIEQISIKEKELANINEQLKCLYEEKDNLEMRQLLQQMKENNLDINAALKKLANSN